MKLVVADLIECSDLVQHHQSSCQRRARMCVDIDECREEGGAQLCEAGTQCVNTDGSYQCECDQQTANCPPRHHGMLSLLVLYCSHIQTSHIRLHKMSIGQC